MKLDYAVSLFRRHYKMLYINWKKDLDYESATTKHAFETFCKFLAVVHKLESGSTVNLIRKRM